MILPKFLLRFTPAVAVAAFMAALLAANYSAAAQGADSSPATSATVRQLPNIVFVLVDDMGYADLGCYGSKFHETPNTDQLAREGVRFTQAYAACPVCSPSRAAILTGKYPARLQTTDYFGGPQPDEILNGTAKKMKGHALLPAPYIEHLPLEEVTIAEALKQHGYRTFMAGKWHLGNARDFGPLKQGFDVNVGGGGAGHPKTYFSPYGNPELPDGPAGEYLTDRLTSETIAFIEKNAGAPFFVYLPYYAVHLPLQARPDQLAKYEAKRKQLGLRDEFTSDGRTTVRVNQSNPVYAAMVESVDDGVGRIMAALMRLGLEQNTIVILTSDNGGVSTAQGWPTSNLPMRAGKGWMYEGGIREPLIVKWPGVTKPGTINPSVVTGTDFYPTLLEMAGLPLQPGQHKDGVSLAGILRSGDTLPASRPLFWHYPHYGDQGGSPASCVRDGDWKLIRFYEGNRTELYNLRTDAGEQHDLAATEPGITAKLAGELDKWLAETGAKFPTPNPNFKGGKGR